MDLLINLSLVLLFVALTPGILVRIPKRGKPFTVALIHGLIFAVVFHFTAKMLYNAGYIEEFKISYMKERQNPNDQLSIECKTYAKQWEETERAKFKLIAELANTINLDTKALNDKKTDPKGACQKMMSKGKINMSTCMNNYMTPSALSWEESRIKELENKLKNDMVKIDIFQKRFEPACRGKSGCEYLIGRKVEAQAKVDWYCTAKMDTECKESMKALADSLSQLEVYKC